MTLPKLGIETKDRSARGFSSTFHAYGSLAALKGMADHITYMDGETVLIDEIRAERRALLNQYQEVQEGRGMG